MPSTSPCIIDKRHDTTVELVEHQGKKYVLKTFDKQKVMESESRSEEIVNERDLLKQIDFPLINKLVTTTKDEAKLCLILELAKGVDLVNLLRVNSKLPPHIVRLVIAQVRILHCS